MFAQSRRIQDLVFLTVCGGCYLIFYSMIDHTFSTGEQAGQQVGQSSTRTVSKKRHHLLGFMCKMRSEIFMEKTLH